MKRRDFLTSIALSTITPYILQGNSIFLKSNEENYKQGLKDRKYWIDLLYKITHPVFYNLANNSLVKNMPVEKSPTYDSRENVTYLEAVGRSAAGIAPWLSLPDDNSEESILRKEIRDLFIQGIVNGVDPMSPDYLNFRTEKQPIVDAAYLAHAFIRAPKSLWDPLDSLTKKRIITEFKALRSRKPHKNNWLIFRALTECFLLSIGEEWDKKSVDYAIDNFNNWYVGDGWYGDGPKFTFDYYNSYVMHPMMVDTLKIMHENKFTTTELLELAQNRMSRYVQSLERMISPVGTFPVIGRSITYRTGAFHALAMSCLNNSLPEGIKPSQVRCALTAIKKNLLKDDIFDKNGWLQLGFCGHQPEIADYYTSTGSLYMATLSFLPLGLPPSHEFWNDAPQDWTSKKAWKGENISKDYHIQY